MSERILQSVGAHRLNERALRIYTLVIAALAVGAMLYALLNLNIRYTYLAIGLVTAFVIVINPRLAMYQFVFLLFIDYPVIPGIPVYAIDLGASMVVMAAVLDVLLCGTLPRRIPRLTFNYLYILAALAVCGLVGYWPQLVAQRLASFLLLIMTFLSIYRLMRKVSLSELVNWFFVLAVFHSAITIGPFFASGGEYRSFGAAAGVFFDDLTMVALPIGLSLYLGSSKGKGLLYLAGSLIVLGGLVATQSRASLLFSLAVCAFVIMVVRYRTLKGSTQTELRALVRSRLRLLLGASGALAVAVVILKAGLLVHIISRFQELFTFQVVGSLGFRLQLWERAWVAFIDHPFFGIGPGGFSHLSELYPTLHLTTQFHYLRTLGAHNVLLHYLAITGLVGGIGLIAICVNQFRLTWRTWSWDDDNVDAVKLAALSWGALFLFTVLIEAGWMWGHLSFTAVFLAALVSRLHSDSALCN